jgi:hypothetical protein
MISRTASNTYTPRAITAGTDISVTNGDGVSGNPTIAHPTFGTAGTYGSASTVPVITTNSTGHSTSIVGTAISILSSAVSNFASSVLSNVLTGFSVGSNTPIVATDTILQALGKIQAQINALGGGVDPWTELVTTADIIVSSNVTLTNVTALQFSVVSGRTYFIQCIVKYRSAATNTGIAFTMGSGSGAAGDISLQVNIPNSGDGNNAIYGGNISSFGDIVVSSATPAVQPTWFTATMIGTFVCTSSGTVVPRFRSDNNGTNVNFGTGSVILVREFS